MLCKLQSKYKSPPAYGYDLGNLIRRGRERAEKMIKLIPSMGKRIIELGCWDGMVSRELQLRGKDAYAIDNRDEGFEALAKENCTEIRLMDVHDLQYEDNYFNFAFSYDTFEHFCQPAQALSEIIRVVKSGGYIYLFFGPLYNSAYGLHGYRSITVPYCQHLFDRDVLDKYITIHELKPIDYAQINYKELNYFRILHESCPDRVDSILYNEIPYVLHTGIINKYPGCFCDIDFDELTISHIEMLLRVK